MASITLRSLSSPASAGVTVKNAPLTNVEVDTNFDNVNANKLERNGTIPLTGKLTLVSSSASQASLRLVSGDAPSTPVSGDLWNQTGVLKFAIASDTIVNILSSSNLIGTANQVIVNTNLGATTLTLPQSINSTANVRFGSLGIGLAAPGVSGRIEATQDVVAYSSSDERLKTEITNIEDALDKVKRLNGVMFVWDETKKDIHGYTGRDSGVIAQDVEAVIPELVATREDGYKAVKYEKIVGLLIEAIKELSERLDNCNCNCTVKEV